MRSPNIYIYILVGRVLKLYSCIGFDMFETLNVNRNREDKLIKLKKKKNENVHKINKLELKSQMNQKIHVWFRKSYGSCKTNGKIIYFLLNNLLDNK